MANDVASSKAGGAIRSSGDGEHGEEDEEWNVIEAIIAADTRYAKDVEKYQLQDLVAAVQSSKPALPRSCVQVMTSRRETKTMLGKLRLLARRHPARLQAAYLDVSQLHLRKIAASNSWKAAITALFSGMSSLSLGVDTGYDICELTAALQRPQALISLRLSVTHSRKLPGYVEGIEPVPDQDPSPGCLPRLSAALTCRPSPVVPSKHRQTPKVMRTPDPGFGLLFAPLANLRALTLDRRLYVDVVPTVLRVLADPSLAPRLAVINITRGASATYDELAPVLTARAGHIRAVSLSSDSEVRSSAAVALMALTRCVGLRSVSLTHCLPTDEDAGVLVSALQSWPLLRTLSATNSTTFRASFTLHTLLSVRVMSRLRNLRRLDLVSCSMDEDHAQLLADVLPCVSATLERLDISLNASIGAGVLLIAARLPELRKLTTFIASPRTAQDPDEESLMRLLLRAPQLGRVPMPVFRRGTRVFVQEVMPVLTQLRCLNITWSHVSTRPSQSVLEDLPAAIAAMRCLEDIELALVSLTASTADCIAALGTAVVKDKPKLGYLSIRLRNADNNSALVPAGDLFCAAAAAAMAASTEARALHRVRLSDMIVSPAVMARLLSCLEDRCPVFRWFHYYASNDSIAMPVTIEHVTFKFILGIPSPAPALVGLVPAAPVTEHPPLSPATLLEAAASAALAAFPDHSPVWMRVPIELRPSALRQRLLPCDLCKRYCTPMRSVAARRPCTLERMSYAIMTSVCCECLHTRPPAVQPAVTG